MKAFRLVFVLAGLALGWLAPVGLPGLVAPSFAQAPAPAPEAATLQAAKDLVGILNKGTLEQMAVQVTNQIWPQIENALKTKNAAITPEVLAELRGEFAKVQLEFLTTTMADAPTIYARHFTEAELRQLLAFYQAPLGQKALRELPQIMAETMSLIMPRMQQVQQQVMEAFAKVLRARGINI